MNQTVTLAIAVMLAWGIGDTLVASASRRLGEKNVMFWFVILGWIALLPISFIHRDTLMPVLSSLEAGEWLNFLFLGLVQVTAFLMFFRGMKIGKVGVICSLASAWALIPFFVGIFVFRESVTSLQLFSILTIMAGIFMASSELDTWTQFDLKQPGFKEGLITLLLFGMIMTIVVPFSRQWGWLPALFLLRLSTLPWLFLFLWKEVRRPPRGSMALLVLIASLLDISAMGMYSYAAERTQTISILAPLSASYPLVTTVLAYFFMKEKLGVWKLVGIFGIMTGISLLGIFG